MKKVIEVMGKRLSFLDFPSDLPRFGAVNPYGTGSKEVIQTLGRFQSTPQAGGKYVNIRDTYDMVNPQEDPDLVSGKFQPIKGLSELGRGWRSLWEGEQVHMILKYLQRLV